MAQSAGAASGNPFRAILDVGAALVSSLVLEDVFATIAARIGEAMVVWGVEIQTCDVDAGTLTTEAVWRLDGKGSEEPRTGRVEHLAERPSLSGVVSLHEVVEYRAGDASLPFDERRHFERQGLKSALYAPLVVGGETLGVLVALETRFVRTFTSIERDLFRQLCDLAAIAIHNARLYRRMDEQKRHTASLLEASQVLTSSLVLDEVMSLVADGVYRALGVGSVDLYEYRPESDSLIAVASRMPHDPDRAAEWVGTVLPLADHPSFRRVFERHAVVDYHIDAPDLPELDRELYDEMVEYGEKSVIETGLFFGDEIMGCLSLCTFDAVRHLTVEEEDLLVALASTAAMAIRNAKLYRTQEEQNRHRLSLLDAGRAITATVRLDEVLPRITREATLALGTSQACIYDYDAVADTITYRALFESVPSPAPDDDEATAYPLADYPGDRAVLMERRPVVHQLTDPDLSPDRRAGMAAYNEHTTLNIPLWFNDEPLGILRLYEMEQPRVFTEAEIDLAAGLGEQAAIAIHNARLYHELDDQRTRLDSLLGISRALTRSAQGPALYDTITSTCATAFAAPQAIIYEYEDEADALVARSLFETDPIQTGIAAGVIEACADTAAYRGTLLASAPVVEQLSDPHLDPLTRTEMERWGSQTVLNVPLVFQARPLGILMLIWTGHQRTFSRAELAFAMGVGEQAAIALALAGAHGAAYGVPTA